YLAESFVCDLLRDRPRNRHLPHCIVLQPSELGFRQQRMLCNISQQLHRLRTEFAQHVCREGTLILANAHVQVAAHLREFLRELLGASRGSTFLQQISQDRRHPVLFRRLVRASGSHHQARRNFWNRPVRHQCHLESVRQGVTLVRGQSKCLRRTSGGWCLLLCKRWGSGKSHRRENQQEPLYGCPIHVFPFLSLVLGRRGERSCGRLSLRIQNNHRSISWTQIFLCCLLDECRSDLSKFSH